jgi:hypothetical protein
MTHLNNKENSAKMTQGSFLYLVLGMTNEAASAILQLCCGLASQGRLVPLVVASPRGLGGVPAVV